MRRRTGERIRARGGEARWSALWWVGRRGSAGPAPFGEVEGRPGRREKGHKGGGTRVSGIESGPPSVMTDKGENLLNTSGTIMPGHIKLVPAEGPGNAILSRVSYETNAGAPARLNGPVRGGSRGVPARVPGVPTTLFLRRARSKGSRFPRRARSHGGKIG